MIVETDLAAIEARLQAPDLDRTDRVQIVFDAVLVCLRLVQDIETALSSLSHRVEKLEMRLNVHSPH